MSDLFLAEHVPEDIRKFAGIVGPESGEIIAEMEAYAEKEGFPIVGPAVGGWLSQLARMTDARRVFEFGSGYGYSACWFARALPTDGEIILTEMEEANLELAEEYLARMGKADMARFEVGDAIDTAAEYDGEFDVALLDIEKYQYVDAFETIRDAIPVGGVVVADNTMSAGREAPDDTVDFEVLLAALEEESFDLTETSLDELGRKSTQGIIDYIIHLSNCLNFETTLLPLGDGVTVSTRVA